VDAATAPSGALGSDLSPVHLYDIAHQREAERSPLRERRSAWCACTNGSKILPSIPGSIPMPVSRTGLLRTAASE
jgi:hypothetical protein